MALTYIQKTVHPAQLPPSWSQTEGLFYLPALRADQGWCATHFLPGLAERAKGYFSTMNFSLTRGDNRDDVLENYRKNGADSGNGCVKDGAQPSTHTTNIRLVTETDAGKGIWRERDYENIDGLITNVPGLTLVTFCGLCTIIFCRSGASCDRTVAFRLEGNRSPDGTENDRGDGEAFGTKPEDLRVCIGPSICRDCYEVSEDVADAFKEEFGAEISQDDSTSGYSWNGKSILVNKGNGKYQLDLWGANRLVLLDAGILPEHLAVTNVCTKCNPDLFIFTPRDGR